MIGDINLFKAIITWIIMQKPINHLEELSKSLGVTPSNEQIRKYNEIVLSSLSKWVAFDSSNNIVAHGNSKQAVENHSTAKGVPYPEIIPSLAARTCLNPDEPLSVYPDAKTPLAQFHVK